jgi:hypothetical protein
LYGSEYKIIPAEQQEEIEKDIFDTYMDNLLPTKASGPHKECSEGPQLLRKPDNVFKWWDSQTDYPDLRQMAFDFLLDRQQLSSFISTTIKRTTSHPHLTATDAVRCAQQTD